MDAVAILSSLYIRDYKNTEGSQLINVSSTAGYVLFPGATLYAATKLFISTLTEGIDHEMRAGRHKLRQRFLLLELPKQNLNRWPMILKNPLITIRSSGAIIRQPK